MRTLDVPPQPTRSTVMDLVVCGDELSSRHIIHVTRGRVTWVMYLELKCWEKLYSNLAGRKPILLPT